MSIKWTVRPQDHSTFVSIKKNPCTSAFVNIKVVNSKQKLNLLHSSKEGLDKLYIQKT